MNTDDFFFFFFQFPPKKPFPNFKWKWASLQCTESLNDPVVLLGVLERIRKLEKRNQNIAYSSNEFAMELQSLADDIKDHGITVDLARRVGGRNLMRNSGQYWKALGLIPVDSHGSIALTKFGRAVADRQISQSEFAAITIRSLTLPNPRIQSPTECEEWASHGLKIRPLALLLHILHELSSEPSEAYLTKDELIRIVIPLSGVSTTTVDAYKEAILSFRKGTLNVSEWPNCCPEANDHRIAREFLLFLSYHGYVDSVTAYEGEERFVYNKLLDEQVLSIIGGNTENQLDNYGALAQWVKDSDVAVEVDRKRIQEGRNRPNQAKFRQEVVLKNPRCIITNVTMPEILEAAHIVPHKYHGADTPDNGFSMRLDVHVLFDAGHLRIKDDGTIQLSDRARMDYGALIPPRIVIPNHINLDYVRWRWNNYHGY